MTPYRVRRFVAELLATIIVAGWLLGLALFWPEDYHAPPPPPKPPAPDPLDFQFNVPVRTTYRAAARPS